MNRRRYTWQNGRFGKNEWSLHQTTTLPKWMFFPKKFFKSSLPLNGYCAIHFPQIAATTFAFSSVWIFFYCKVGDISIISFTSESRPSSGFSRARYSEKGPGSTWYSTVEKGPTQTTRLLQKLCTQKTTFLENMRERKLFEKGCKMMTNQKILRKIRLFEKAVKIWYFKKCWEKEKFSTFREMLWKWGLFEENVKIQLFREKMWKYHISRKGVL